MEVCWCVLFQAANRSIVQEISASSRMATWPHLVGFTLDVCLSAKFYRLVPFKLASFGGVLMQIGVPDSRPLLP